MGDKMFEREDLLEHSLRKFPFLLLLTTGPLAAQALPALEATVLPVGTPLAVRTQTNIRMKVGARVQGELVYPVYANDRLVLPAGTKVIGSVVSLAPDGQRRRKSLLRADFMPYHLPSVQFIELVAPGGAHLPLTTGPATNGTPIYRALPLPKQKGIVLRQYDAMLEIVRSDVAVVLGPDKLDRLKQFAYAQLPVHPEQIEKQTAWTALTTTTVNLPAHPAIAAPAPAPAVARHFWDKPPAAEVHEPEPAPGRWLVQAYLDQPLSSETSKAGDQVTAHVAQPVMGVDGSVEVSQGAALVGTVTQAVPARSFGRTGTLSFSFRQLQMPGSEAQNVETTLRGADSAEGVALTSEGQVRAQPQDRLTVPLILGFLASRALDEDHGRHRGGGKNAVAGLAGLGLVGSIVGVASHSAAAAAGIGYYGTALALYDRWIAKGKKIEFPQDTRIVVQTVARKNPALKPDAERLK